MKDTLLYDDRCSMCKDLASKVLTYSHDSVEILPLSSSEAHELIHKVYGEKHPYSFFFITQDGYQAKARHGLRAALSIANIVGLTNSFKLLSSYLNYRGKLVSLGEGRPCCGGNGRVDLKKRNSLGLILKGGLILALSAIGLGSLPKLSRASQGVEKEPLEAVPIEGSELSRALEEALSSQDYLNVVHSLTERGMSPQLAGAVAYHIKREHGSPPELGVVVTFGTPGFYLGYVLYRRKAPGKTAAISLLRLVEGAGGPALQPLTMSENGNLTGTPTIATSASCYTPPGSPNHICCPSGLRCCKFDCWLCEGTCQCMDCTNCSCWPFWPQIFYDRMWVCCTHYLCYDKNTGAPAGWQCETPCDPLARRCACPC